ncbi:MAG: histidinol dehydrogenase, partial [Bradymonadia bacterium]
PNHTLPTGGTARFSGGLSVFNFLRVRTWMRIDEPAESKQLVSDAQALAEVEGLWGHKRAAQLRD